MNSNSRPALLVVDVQNDFCQGGTLAVPDGDLILPSLNRLIALCSQLGYAVFATRDWHPADSQHFLKCGGIWPVHCVAGTPGAEFHPHLELPANTVIVAKGQSRLSDGYSAFNGRTSSGVRFRNELANREIGKIYVTGLATDYCVRQSVLDALGIGLNVTLVTDLIAGVDRNPGDVERALSEMTAAGAHFTTAAEIQAKTAQINSL